MPTTIVYLDDADFALQHLAAMAHAGSAGGVELPPSTHWILVGCAPRMTHRISKWVSHSARENWRNKWSDKLFGQAAPWLQARGGTVTTLLAKGPLTELTERLLAEHAGAQVLDARRPKLGLDLPPVSVVHPAPAAPKPSAPDKSGRWSVPGTAMALFGAMLLTTAD